MNQTETDSTEVWIHLHYRYQDESYKFNLPISQGTKALDGVKISLEYNQSEGGQHMVLAIDPEGLLKLESFALTIPLENSGEIHKVFVNGYQSWSESYERLSSEKIPALNSQGRFFSLNRMGDYEFVPYQDKKGRFHSHGFTYMRYPDHIYLIGSICEKIGHTIINIDLRQGMLTLTKDLDGYLMSKKQKLLNIALLSGIEEKTFDIYADMCQISIPQSQQAFAWMSKTWKGNKLDELFIRRNLSVFRDNDIPLDYFIIGNGWQSALGEWKLLSVGFPSGMSSICAEIRGSGFRPGIWFAPFVVGVDSTIFRTRKDWLARKGNKPIKAAGRFLPSGGVYFALDIFRQDVREYITENYNRITQLWKYELIVLDLLYVAALFPPEGMSRGSVMVYAIKFLQSIKGDAKWLFNGVPLSSSFGQADYTRIAAEPTRSWESIYHRNIHFRERASTINALRSTLGRYLLYDRLLSSATGPFSLENSPRSMEPAHFYTQILIDILMGKLILTSDNTAEYTSNELRFFRALFPMPNPKIQSIEEKHKLFKISFMVDDRNYITMINLADRVRTFTLPVGQWFATLPYETRDYHLIGGKKQQIKAGQACVYLKLESANSYAGSSGHIFPGSEIQSISRVGNDWHVVPKQGNRDLFKVWIKTSDQEIVTINGYKPEKKRALGTDILAFAYVESNRRESSLPAEYS